MRMACRAASQSRIRWSKSWLAAIKLIDAQTSRAIANTTARIKLGEIETIELKTNALGYIFIPLEKVEEGYWVTIPGYRRVKIDFCGNALQNHAPPPIE